MVLSLVLCIATVGLWVRAAGERMGKPEEGGEGAGGAEGTLGAGWGAYRPFHISVARTGKPWPHVHPPRVVQCGRVKRIGRYILNGITVLSLVLCVATGGMWWRSYLVGEIMGFGLEKSPRWEVHSAYGSL